MGDDNAITITLDDSFNSDYTVNVNDTVTTTFDISSVLDTEDDLVYTFDTQPQEDFVHTMPSLSRINAMCELYPGLDKAYKNFVTAYKLVEQDYKGKLQSGEIDDEIPF